MMLNALQRKTFADLRLNWKQFLAAWLLVLGVAFYGAMYPGYGAEGLIYRTYRQLNSWIIR